MPAASQKPNVVIVQQWISSLADCPLEDQGGQSTMPEWTRRAAPLQSSQVDDMDPSSAKPFESSSYCAVRASDLDPTPRAQSHNRTAARRGPAPWCGMHTGARPPHETTAIDFNHPVQFSKKRIDRSISNVFHEALPIGRDAGGTHASIGARSDWSAAAIE